MAIDPAEFKTSSHGGPLKSRKSYFNNLGVLQALEHLQETPKLALKSKCKEDEKKKSSKRLLVALKNLKEPFLFPLI